MQLVDTAGLTHLSPDKRLLTSDKRTVRRIEAQGTGPSALPGIRVSLIK